MSSTRSPSPTIAPASLAPTRAASPMPVKPNASAQSLAPPSAPPTRPSSPVYYPPENASFAPSAEPDDPPEAAAPTSTSSGGRGARFWLIFVALGFSLFMSPLELTSVSTALPTIIADLKGDQFVWVASAYTLGSTAILPMSGGAAEIFGRRPCMLLCLALFALGSALCGAAQNMPWLIAARAIQGMGAGSVQSLANIVISDLVPLKERGAITGILGLVWALAAAIGPLVGGALSTHSGQWRWLFYMNLPIAGTAFVLVFTLLQTKSPEGSVREKLGRMDWMGNFLIIASTTACIIGLTWGGSVYAWSSPRVLVPLILGLVGMAGFLVYEAKVAKNPIVPFSVLSNRTSLSGYLQTFINPIVMLSVIYFLPTYFQACRAASPIASGIDMFGLSLTLGPVVILTGISVSRTASYRWQAWLGWCLLIVACGLLSTVKSTTPLARAVGYPVLVGVGGGIAYAVTYFPVLAPLPVTQSAHALAFFAFCRAFAGVWGVTVGGTILQNGLNARLPAAFAAALPSGDVSGYAAVTSIAGLPEPLRAEVRAAFAESIAVIWRVMAGVAGAGLLASLMMRDVPMHAKTDEKWKMEEKRGEDAEMEMGEMEKEEM